MENTDLPPKGAGRREFLKIAGSTAILAGISPRELFANLAPKAAQNPIHRLIKEPFSFALVGDFGAGNTSPAPRSRPISSPNPDCLAVAELIRETTPPQGDRYIVCVGDMCYLPLNKHTKMVQITDVSVYDEAIGQFYHPYIQFPAGSASQYANQGADRQRFYFELGDHDWWHMPRKMIRSKLYYPLDHARFPATYPTHPIPQFYIGSLSQNPFLEYFGPQGGSESVAGLRYYEIKEGAVHWIALSSDANETLLGTLENAYYFPDVLPNGSTPGSRNLMHSKQGRWFRKTASQPKRGFRFVVTHYPPYSSSAADPPYNGHSSATYMQWGYEKYGVDAVFTGHVHAYERLYVNGVTYVTCGGGGTFEPVASFASPPLEESLVRVPKRFGFLGALEKRGKIFFHYVAADTPNTKGPTSIEDRFVFLNRGVLSKREEMEDQLTIHVTSGGGVLLLDDFDMLFGNVLAGTGRLRKSGARELKIADQNPNFSGTLEIRRGAVSLARSHSLNEQALVELSGGELRLKEGISQDMSTPLAVLRSSTLHLAEGAKISFGRSGSQTWPDQALLVVAGSLGPHSLRVGTNRQGLRGSQLKAIRFGTADGPGARITESGFVAPV